MKPTKTERQASLLQLIKEREISTQEELVTRLNEAGLYATQATISRDIKELGIIKISTGRGQQKYVALERGSDAPAGRLMKVFAEAVVSVDQASHLVVIKTLPGMAQASAAAADSMALPEIVGTIAGDDTIFIALRTPEQASDLCRLLEQMMMTVQPWSAD